MLGCCGLRYGPLDCATAQFEYKGVKRLGFVRPLRCVFCPFTMSFLFLVLSLGIFCVFLVKRRQSRLPLPPGPKPWPIIGNVYDVPSIRPWEKYREWCEHFSEDPCPIPLHIELMFTPFRIRYCLCAPANAAYRDPGIRESSDGSLRETVSSIFLSPALRCP